MPPYAFNNLRLGPLADHAQHRVPGKGLGKREGKQGYPQKQGNKQGKPLKEIKFYPGLLLANITGEYNNPIS